MSLVIAFRLLQRSLFRVEEEGWGRAEGGLRGHEDFLLEGGLFTWLYK